MSFRSAALFSCSLVFSLGCGPKKESGPLSLMNAKHPVLEDIKYPTFQNNGRDSSWPIPMGSVVDSQSADGLYYLSGALYQNGFVLKQSIIRRDVQENLLALSPSESSECRQTHCSSSLIGKNLPIELVFWSALLSLFEESALMTQAQAKANGRGKYHHKTESLRQGLQENNEKLTQIAQREELQFYASPSINCSATIHLFSEDDQRHLNAATQWLVENGHRSPEWKIRQDLGLDADSASNSVAFQQTVGPTGQYELNMMIVEANESPMGDAELNDIHLFCTSPQPIFAKEQTAYSVSASIDSDAGWRVSVGSN